MANFQKSLSWTIKRQEQLQGYLLKNMADWEWMLIKCQSQFRFKKLSKPKRKGNFILGRINNTLFKEKNK